LPDGCTEAILIAHGIITIEQMVDLARAAGKSIEVTRLRITETGRRTLSALGSRFQS
jgi:hypothetical protein